ncbi:MAG: hypothetical protein ACPKM0_01800 [Pleomorphochaeta sp.]
MKAQKEDFFGKATHQLIEKCKLCLYFYPLQIKAINEDRISDFFIINQKKIRNTVYNYNCKKISFKDYFLNYIRICIKYYKLKENHDALYNNIMLEVLVKNTDSFEKETIYEENTNKPKTIATLKYKVVEEEQKKYFEKLDSQDFITNKTFLDLYQEIIETENKVDDIPKYKNINQIKNFLSKKSTRKNILLLFLTMPDAILENYINEVSYLFSVEKITIINLFTFASELLVSKKLKYEKYSNLNNKHYKNYLINNYKLTSNFYDPNQLQISINWDKKAMDNNAEKIRKTLNMHVSQRTLAKELNINKGTVASSISAAKKLLNNRII